MSVLSENKAAWTFRVWGCRGGVPTWGPSAARYGGHTTCLELDLPDARIVIDAGSGLCELGRQRGVDRKPTLLLMTHMHWDHVIGIPHWSAIYSPGWDLTIRGVPREGTAPVDWLLDFNRPPVFPVHLREAHNCRIQGDGLPLSGSDRFAGIAYEWMEVAHPGGCSAFALTVKGRRFVFSGDIELPKTDRAAFLAFCRGAEALILDAQYDHAEYERFIGWGHSTNVQAAEFASEAGVQQLLLTHHDPRKDDTEIDALVATARRIFANTRAVYCGMDVASGELAR
jgi:phosphoribosyl 1,2-cyclic phosphodiesterase